MANTYAFSVTASEVKNEQLSFLQEFNTSFMDDAIDRAASQLNVILRSLRITPSTITAANAVDDFNWCRSVVILGASGYYLWLATGTWQSGGDRVAAMQEQIKMLRDSPQMLESYNENASSTATARSRNNYDPGPSNDSETQNARARFLQPAIPSRWRQ
jgi:hypothetical protein